MRQASALHFAKRAKRLRVALVHDLIGGVGGSENVLIEFHRMFPDAPVYMALFDPTRRSAKFDDFEIRTSFLQRLRFGGPNYEAVVPFMPLAFENFDLRDFDLVISSCYACSKGVLTPAESLHVCYCYTPMRWAWSHQEDYVARVRMRPVAAPLMRLVLARMRRWDFVAAQRVDQFIAPSITVQNRIVKFYRRPADVVYPPVDLERFAVGEVPSADAPFVVVSRLFPYKRVHIAVEACSRLNFPLHVIGQGPELNHLRRLAGPTVQFLGEVSDTALESAYRKCRALLFTSDEDLGLAPIEAMASGRPVLGLNAGGARETIVPGVTGQLYDDSGVDALVEALTAFRPDEYDPQMCRRRAEDFSLSRFRDGIRNVLERELGFQLDDQFVPMA